MTALKKIHTILYVENQDISSAFYQSIFGEKPSLDVQGMTEFQLLDFFTLGLMPNRSIAEILTEQTAAPESGTGIPRCELYLVVENVDAEFKKVTNLGIQIISTLKARDWGDSAFYFADPDGHIIAFASKTLKNM